jgi:hypothetical protein
LTDLRKGNRLAKRRVPRGEQKKKQSVGDLSQRKVVQNCPLPRTTLASKNQILEGVIRG